MSENPSERRDELLLSFVDEKLKSYAKKDDVAEIAANQVDGMIKKAKAPFVWFLSGASAVLLAFAIDLSSFDSFARKSFALAFGMNRTIDDRAGEVLDDYFSKTNFLAGTYAVSEEIFVDKCEPVVLTLPFQSNVDKHLSSAFLSIAFPDGEHVYSITPVVNSTAVGTTFSHPADRDTKKSSNFHFPLTKTMRGVPVQMRSSGFIHDYWVKIEILPPSTNASNEPTEASRLASLSGLPRAQSFCPRIGDFLKIRMLVQVTGDPRVKEE